MTDSTGPLHNQGDALWSAAREESAEVTRWRRYRDLILALLAGLLIVGAGVWNTLAGGPIHPHV